MAATSPRIVLFCSASLPITLTNTRACFRSGVTRTSVIATSPSIRGSFNSPATMMPNSCRISSATRSCRCPATVIVVSPDRKILNPNPFKSATSLKNFQFVSNQIASQVPFGILKHGTQRLFEKSCIVSEAHDAHHRALPGVLPFQFRHGHVKFSPQPVLQAAEHLPLVFKRVRLGDINFQGEQTDRHLHPCEHLQDSPRLQGQTRIRQSLRPG